MKNRVLFLIPTLKVAGAEKVCANICDNLNYNEFEVHLLTLTDQIPLWQTLKNTDSIHLYCGHEKSNMRFPWLSIKTFFCIRRIVKEIKPDIVHSHLWGIKCFYLLSFCGMRSRPEFISTIHSSEFIYTSKKLIDRIFAFVENTVYKLLNYHLVSISDAVDKMVRMKLYYQTLTKIENGIDTHVFSSKKVTKQKIFLEKCYQNNYPVLVNVGRASETKRQIDIIESISLILSEFPNVKLLLIGRDNEEKYKNAVNALGLTSQIEFIESTNNVSDYLQIADIAIFPSLYEGLSLSMAEKMASGLPIIITDIPSLTEMTNGSQASVIVPLKSPEKIAEAIRNLINHPELMKQIGSKAQELAISKYSVSKMVNRYECLYKKLLSKGSEIRMC